MPAVTPIRTDGSNAFAHHTVTVRLPKMIDQVIAQTPGLPPKAATRLRELQQELLDDAPLRMFNPPAPDHEAWVRTLAAHDDRIGHPASWRNSEWFTLEHFFFRRILAAVDYWNTGTDPFGSAKAREVASPALGLQVDSVLRSASPDALAARLTFALWGNRMDLSHSDSVSHAAAAEGWEHDDALIVDDSASVWKVARELNNPVHFVCDNAGTELAADLCLADWFVHERSVPVHLHVKEHPTFVSDATPSDVHALLDRLGSPGSSLVQQQLADRLTTALNSGELQVVPDLFWNSPGLFTELPDRILSTFARSGLIIVKGDMNYRRMLGDVIPPATDPLAAWAAPMPAPTTLLRTMKGDPIAGIAPERLASLNREHPGWRTAGKHGVIQLVE
jgi:uncharacterized protein with ATP-grasp and redox domains